MRSRIPMQLWVRGYIPSFIIQLFHSWIHLDLWDVSSWAFCTVHLSVCSMNSSITFRHILWVPHKEGLQHGNLPRFFHSAHEWRKKKSLSFSVMSSFSLNLFWYLDHHLALQTFWQTSCSWCVWRNDSLLAWFAFLAVSPVPSGLPYYMWSARVYILFCFLHLDLVCWLIEGRLFASGNLLWATLMSLCSSQVFLNRWRISVLRFPRCGC